MFLLVVITGVVIMAAIASASPALWIVATVLLAISVGIYAAKRERK